MATTKNLIFDLGNVLYDIDFTKMYAAFNELGIPNFENHFTLNKSDQIFFDLELGLISEQQFCDGFNALYHLSLTKRQIIEAWNSLLIGYRPQSIEWVKANNSNYNTFLYSNTNQIHYDHFIPQFEQEMGGNFENLFKTPYFSHKMGQRKPDPASFKHILEKEGLVAEETIFIDDNEPNIIAAASVGLQVLYLQPGMRVENDLIQCILHPLALLFWVRFE
jgi:putative hydrolase of the HAD superfamily